MILSGPGPNGSRSLEQNAAARGSNIEEKKEEDVEPDHNTADLGARHFVKQATLFAAGHVVLWVVVVPLLVFLTFKLFWAAVGRSVFPLGNANPSLESEPGGPLMAVDRPQPAERVPLQTEVCQRAPSVVHCAFLICCTGRSARQLPAQETSRQSEGDRPDTR